jgi:hypothetical protein
LIYKTFAGNPEGKKLRGKTKRRWIIILKCVLERWDRMVWARLIWLRIRTRGGTL